MSIAEITPHQARSRAASGAVFIDVRQSYERVSGQAEGALGIDQATLEAHSSTHLPDTNAEIVLICQSGQRSRHTGSDCKQRVIGGCTPLLAEPMPGARPVCHYYALS